MVYSNTNRNTFVSSTKWNSGGCYVSFHAFVRNAKNIRVLHIRIIRIGGLKTTEGRQQSVEMTYCLNSSTCKGRKGALERYEACCVAMFALKHANSHRVVQWRKIHNELRKRFTFNSST